MLHLPRLMWLALWLKLERAKSSSTSVTTNNLSQLQSSLVLFNCGKNHTIKDLYFCITAKFVWIRREAFLRLHEPGWARACEYMYSRDVSCALSYVKFTWPTLDSIETYNWTYDAETTNLHQGARSMLGYFSIFWEVVSDSKFDFAQQVVRLRSAIQWVEGLARCYIGKVM